MMRDFFLFQQVVVTLLGYNVIIRSIQKNYIFSSWHNARKGLPSKTWSMNCLEALTIGGAMVGQGCALS
jgi:hypothetical protein